MRRFKSRLRSQRPQILFSVKSKSITGGQNVETTSTTAYGTIEPIGDNPEVISEAGVMMVASDVVWFERVSGALPTITENHVLLNGTTRYEVVANPGNQGGKGNRLKVIVRRVLD